MKKLLYLTIVLFSGYWSATAQTNKVVQLTYNASDFNITHHQGYSIITSKVHKLGLNPDGLTPALPYISFNVLISPDFQYESVNVSSAYELFKRNIVLPPNVLRVISNEDTNDNFSMLSKYIYPLGVYPSEAIQYVGTYEKNGYKYLSFHLYPLKYNSQNKKLFLSKTFKIDIHLKTDAVKDHYFYSEDANIRASVRKMVVNDDMESYYPLHTNKSLNTNEPYQYLLITSNTLKQSFQHLAQWKTTKGIRTKLLTIEEINANSLYNGSIIQEKIKQAIRAYYYSDGIKYVLLGGDQEMVPALKVIIRYNSPRYPNFYRITPCDWYYSCLGSLNWDTNGNGIFGEVEDSVDIAPEVAVTRIPVNTSNEADVIINRIIQYERSPNNNWTDKLLLTGADTTTHNINGTIKSDAHYKSDSLYQTYIAPLWNCSVKRFYDTDTDFPSGPSFQLNATNLQQVLSNGYSIINMDSHGDSICWVLENGYYNNRNASIMYNPKNSIIITTACTTNAFDALGTDCLSEHIIKNQDSGILGYFGCSREGWKSILTMFWGDSNRFDIELYNNLLQAPSNHWGVAVKEAKSSFICECDTNTTERWLLFGINPLGDPEMPFYLSCPNTFDNVSVNFTDDNLTINTGVTDTNICVMSTSDFGESFYQIIPNICQTSLQPTCHECTVCITKAGYVPLVTTAVNTKYIQNQTITDNLDVVNGKTYIGRNVTTSVSEGPVVIQSGETNITSTNGVYIKNSFKVNPGAKFKINIVN